MAILIVVIQMVFFSLAMADQQLTTNLDGWWYLVKPVQISSLSSSPSELPSIQPPVRRADYTYTPGVGSHKVHTLATTWNRARKACQEEGGHLVIIDSIEEKEVISELLEKAGAIVGGKNDQCGWIGLHDFFEEGEYVTIHGQSLATTGFTRWASGEPNGGDQSCVCFNKGAGYIWDDRCHVNYAFICELPVY